MVESQVLLLDDVGRELKRSNRLPETTFDNVLRTRVQHGRSTIITTNMTPDELGRDTAARCCACCGRSRSCIEVGGDDYRKQANQRELDEIADGETQTHCLTSNGFFWRR